MTRYQIERILFVVFLALSTIALDQVEYSFGWLIPPIVVFAMYLAYNAFHLETQFYLKSIVEGKDNKKGISITFDDGPNKLITPEILTILEKHGVKATFFCIGKHAEENPDILKNINKAGHIVASHSYSHKKWIGFNSVKDWEKEISTCNKLIEGAIGKRPRFFRAPYGVGTPNLGPALINEKMLSIGWNIRSLDTLNNNVLEIVDRSTHNLKDGCIVLFHDNLDWSCEVLEEFLVRTKKMNLNVVPLSELIDENAYEN